MAVSRLEKRLKIVANSPFFLPPLALASPLGCRSRVRVTFHNIPQIRSLLIRTAHVGGKRGPEVNLTFGCRRPLENVWYYNVCGQANSNPAKTVNISK